MRVWAAASLWTLLAAAATIFDASYQAGLRALGNNNFATAQTQLEIAAKLQPRNAQVLLALTQAYFKLNKTALANETARKAELLAPSDPVVLHGLAFFYTETHQPARAAAFEARYADKSPQDQEAYGRAIDLYLRAQLPKAAILLAQKALARTETPELHGLLAKAYDLDGQLPKAVGEYQLAIKLRPYDEGYISEFAQAYLRRQKYAEALHILQDAHQRFDKSAQIDLATGMALYGLERFPESIDALLETVQLSPEIDQPYLLLGRLLEKAGPKMPDVSAALATYVSVKPQNYMSNFLYAKALIVQNAERLQVEPLLRKSISLKSDFWESHFELGAVLEKDRDYPDAAIEYQKAVSLDAREPSPHSGLSRVYEKLGKPLQAAQQRALYTRLSEQHKSQSPPPLTF